MASSPRSKRANSEAKNQRQARPNGSRSPKKAQRKSGLARLDDGLVYVLSHPLRVRMLASLSTEGDASASELARRLNCTTHNTSYHMRILRQNGCVEFVRTERVRSVEKRIYRAKVAVHFPKEIWEALPPSVQQMVVAAVFMTSYSDAEVALMSRAYEIRPESHASWSNAEVDEEGWLSLVELFNGTLVKAKEIEDEAKARKRKGNKAKAETLTVSLSLAAFVLPDDVESIESRVKNPTARQRVKAKRILRH